MKRASMSVVFCVLSAAALFAAQQRPNLSGRWVQVSPAEGAGGEQTIHQTETRLTMNHGSEGGGHELVYNLDGSEARSTMTSHGMDVVTISKATWKGDRLTITSTSTYSPDRKLDQTTVWWIDEKGQLIVELTATMTGRPTEKMTIVHKKR